jgi:hypothetical protein
LPSALRTWGRFAGGIAVLLVAAAVVRTRIANKSKGGSLSVGDVVKQVRPAVVTVQARTGWVLDAQKGVVVTMTRCGDLAGVKVGAKEAALPLGSVPAKGDSVVAVGPRASRSGVVTAVRPRVVRVSFVLEPGAPLVDRRGRLVGVMTRGSDAIGVDRVKALLPALLSTRAPARKCRRTAGRGSAPTN